MNWEELKNAAPGYYFVDASTVPAELPKEMHAVAWVTEEPGTRAGETLINIIVKILPTLVKGVIAIFILAAIGALAYTILRVDVTVLATDKEGRPTLLKDNRGNVYTIDYNDEGNAFIKNKANPNEWIVNLGIVVAVIVIAAALTIIAYKVVGSPRPSRLVPYSPPPIPSVPPPPPPPPTPAKVLPPPTTATAKVPS